jgi:hypothetical protein
MRKPALYGEHVGMISRGLPYVSLISARFTLNPPGWRTPAITQSKDSHALSSEVGYERANA